MIDRKEANDMKRGMFLYPWDLLDNGIDETIEQLKEMQITYVSLAILYHTAKILLPHDLKHHLYLNEGGTCFYDFDPDRYIRLMPQKNKLLASYPGNFIKDIIIRFHEAGIKVCAWVVVFHNDYLAKKFSDCAIQSCYEESSPTNLCPSNPEVYTYGLKLIEEIALLGVDEVHLESADYAGFLHGDHHEMQAYGDTFLLERLLGLCFCPHCRKKAQQEGIDVQRLLELIKQEADNFFSLRKASTTGMEIRQLFSSYLQMRQKNITLYYQDIQEMLHRNGLKTKVKPILWLSGGSDPLLYGVDIRQKEAYVDGVIAAYPDTPKTVPGFVNRIKEMVPASVLTTGGIRLMAPNTTGKGQVKEYFEAYQKCNMEDVIFYNYGMAPWPLLEQLKEI